MKLYFVRHGESEANTQRVISNRESHFGLTEIADVTFVGSRLTAPADTEGYRRYALTENGVSPMAIPGTAGATYTADGLEHNERGTPSSQAADHAAQMDKRARKLAHGAAASTSARRRS